MYIWRKRAAPHWLRIYGNDLAQRFGNALAIVERPGGKTVLLEISCPTEKPATELIRKFGGRVEKLRPDWLHYFSRRAQGKPLHIGSRLVVLSEPPRRAGLGQRRTEARWLIIPAEAAFGTGEHATTAMCLRLLEQITRRFDPGWRMLDAGTGSGILALAGSCFGAGQVLAIDSDPLACSTAKRNARANRVDNLDVATDDILKRKLTGKFRVITANLFSEILIEALPIWSRHLDPGGCLILSGILRSQEATVIRALRRHGFTVAEIRRRGKWIAILVHGRAVEVNRPCLKNS